MSFGAVAAWAATALGATATTAAVVGAVASGAYGLYQGNAQKRLAKQALKRGDPFGPHREEYAGKLKALMDDPSTFLNNPLYKAAFSQGLQAVMRGFAGQGFIGSGNMAAGLQQYGMSFAYDAEREQEKFLAHLAGADISPNSGPGLAGYAAGVETQGGGLSSLFSGLDSIFTGGGGGMGGVGGMGGPLSTGPVGTVPIQPRPIPGFGGG